MVVFSHAVGNQEDWLHIAKSNRIPPHFGDHGVDVLGGIEARRNVYKGLTSTGYGWTPEYGEQFNPVLTGQL